MSEVSEEVGSQIAKTTLSPQENPHGMYGCTLYMFFPETRVIGLHFCHRVYGYIVIQICAVGSK